MAEAKKFITNFILGAVAIALGIIIFTHADKFIMILMIGAGLAGLVNGVSTLLSVKEWNFNDNTKKATLIKGIIISVIGLVAVIVPWFVADTVITVIAIVFGAVLIYSAIIAIKDATDARKANAEADITRFIMEAVIELLLAIILIANPAGILITFAKIVGIGVIVLGGVFIFLGVKEIKGSSPKADDAVEVEIVEEKEEKEDK